ncbi:MAG: glutathione S-transferase [Gammaproteobacteria bacterium]|nr:glutathione S-transferase [Gammaproteobacteria bacterium]
MPTLLYQFPVSHYCEKARWALDYKGVPFKTQTLLPGPHIKKIKSIAADSSVPVLRMQNTIIQGSDQIIDYLDATVSEKPLTPQDSKLREQAADWERFAADKIADPLRCFYYHYLLDEPKTLIPLFCEDGPWYGNLLMRLIFKRLGRRMRAVAKINPRTAGVAMHVVDKALTTLEKQLQTQPFLVGDRFSRADLSVCALLSPLVLPERGYMKARSLTATALQDYRKAHISSPVFRWVNTIYNTYR